MDATVVAIAPPQVGEITTVEVQALGERFAKFARFRKVKRELAALRREHDALEHELFAEPPR